MIAWPMDCQDCGEEDRQMFGCGDGYEGRATVPYELGARTAPYNRTCPRWYIRQPGVAAIFDDLEDYRRGGLGNILALEAPYLEALRVADSERLAWTVEMDRQCAAERT